MSQFFLIFGLAFRIAVHLITCLDELIPNNGINYDEEVKVERFPTWYTSNQAGYEEVWDFCRRWGIGAGRTSTKHNEGLLWNVKTMHRAINIPTRKMICKVALQIIGMTGPRSQPTVAPLTTVTRIQIVLLEGDLPLIPQKKWSARCHRMFELWQNAGLIWCLNYYQNIRSPRVPCFTNIIDEQKWLFRRC